MINKTEMLESKCCVCGNIIVSEVTFKELDFERKREWIEKFGGASHAELKGMRQLAFI